MVEDFKYLESFLIILDSFSENLSVKKLIEQKMLGEMVEILKKLYSHKYLIHKHEFLEKLKEKIICSYCLENPVSTLLDCEHNFCTYCTEYLIISHKNPSELLVCPLCQKTFLSHTEADYLQKCYSCEYYLPSNCFYSNNICLKYCKNCISFSFLKKNYQFLKEFYQGDRIYSETEKCEKCGKIVLIRHANFLCKIHVYCFSCFKSGLFQKKCFSCNRIISDELFEACRKLMTYYCVYCKTNKERIFFVEKNCCKVNVCITCQVEKDLKKCRKCLMHIDIKQIINI